MWPKFLFCSAKLYERCYPRFKQVLQPQTSFIWRKMVKTALTVIKVIDICAQNNGIYLQYKQFSKIHKMMFVFSLRWTEHSALSIYSTERASCVVSFINHLKWNRGPSTSGLISARVFYWNRRSKFLAPPIGELPTELLTASAAQMFSESGASVWSVGRTLTFREVRSWSSGHIQGDTRSGGISTGWRD